MREDNTNVLDFARKISMLRTNTKIANEFDEKYGQKDKRWWHCQREHLVVWCLHYPTGGTRGFTHKPNNNAQTMYNYFRRPETLLWLAEALGENEDKLKWLIEEIKDKPPITACKIIRKNISFARVLSLLEQNNLNTEG